jgi:hypothetical protein
VHPAHRTRKIKCYDRLNPKVYFGNSTLFVPTLISLVVGALLAYLSEIPADAMLRRNRREEPTPS